MIGLARFCRENPLVAEREGLLNALRKAYKLRARLKNLEKAGAAISEWMQGKEQDAIADFLPLLKKLRDALA